MSSHEAAKVSRLNSFITMKQQINKKVKKLADISKYFNHCSNELEAHGGGQFLDFLCEHIGKIQV